MTTVWWSQFGCCSTDVTEADEDHPSPVVADPSPAVTQEESALPSVIESSSRVSSRPLSIVSVELADRVLESSAADLELCTTTSIGSLESTASFPADWESNDASTSCRICQESFGILNRKHHCRKCGVLVCTTCSRSRAVLGENQAQVVRICDKCKIRKSDSVSPSRSRTIRSDDTSSVGSNGLSWERNDVSASCRVCKETFSLFNRKHHCRKCGRLVCGVCSQAKGYLEGAQNKNPVRICTDCTKDARLKTKHP